jgi:hypothetical protein
MAHNLTGGINDIYRNISLNSDVTLFDYDADMWSIVNFTKSPDAQMFFFSTPSGDRHPRAPFMVSAVAKVLEREYSSFYYPEGIERQRRVYTGIPNKMHRVKLVQAMKSERLCLLELPGGPGSARRYEGFDDAFLQWIRVGVADAMVVSETFFNSLPVTVLPGDLTRIGFNETFGVTLGSDEFMIIQGHYALQTNDFFLMQALLPTGSRLIRNFPRYFLQEAVFFIDIVNRLPQVFRTGGLVRGTSEKAVYLIHNYTRVLYGNVSSTRSMPVTVIPDLLASLAFPLLLLERGN